MRAQPSARSILAAVFAAILFAGAAARVPAGDIALSLGTWVFPGGDDGPGGTGSGIDVSAGMAALLGPRWEFDFALVAEMTPDPGGRLFAAATVGYSLLGETYGKHGDPGPYVNSILEAGVLLGLGFNPPADPALSTRLMVRIVPLTVGNPHYGRRDRMFALALLYDVRAASIGWAINLFTFDFFL